MRLAANRQRPRRLRAVAAVACALPVLSLSACGFEAQTNQMYQPAEGSNHREGSVLVLNAVIVSDGSGTGTLSTTLHNQSTTADQLTEVSGTVMGGQVAGEKVAPEVGLTVDVAQPVDLPPRSNVDLSERGISVESARLTPGGYADLTFRFKSAGQIKLDVPIVPPTGQFADLG